MKKFIVFYLFIIVFIHSAFSNNFEITPLVINFQGVEARNDTIVAYGDFGSMLISYDNAANWEQVRIFDRGIILRLYWDDTTMVAFNDAGDVAVSKNKGNKWNVVINLNDSVLASIKYSEGYFLRGRNKLFTITNDFKLKNEFQLYTKVLTSEISFYTPNYSRSLAYFKDNLIAEADSSCFIRFDNNLIPIDTLSFYKSGIFDSSYKYKTGFMLDTDSQYLYMRVKVDYIINDTIRYSVDTIYRSKDFKTIEKYNNLFFPYSLYKIIDNKYYCLQKDSKYLNDTTKLSNTQYYQWGYDFTVVNNKQIIVGANKLIELVDLKDSSINIISEFSNYSIYIVPEKIGDSSYLFYSGDNYKYLPFVYRTDNNGITFKPTVDKTNPIYKNSYSYYRFRFKYFDEIENKIYLGGNQHNFEVTRLFISEDYGKSFNSKLIEDLHFQRDPTYGNYENANSLPNFQRNNDNFIIVEGVITYKDTIRENIVTLNKDFDVVSRVKSNDMVIDYVHSKDTNTFLIHCANAIDKTSELRFTSDKGNNWEIINKYPITDTMTHYKEIEINNQKYLALIHVNGSVPSIKLDVVNLSNNKFDNIYEWKTNNPSPDWVWFGVGIDSENNWVYITFRDTLFYTNDLFDRNKWKYQKLPVNSKIKNCPFKKFVDRFFVGYADDNIPSTRGYLAETGIFWLKPLDSITSVDENEIEVQNYLYAYPPYPLPAMKEVRSLIYWDLSLDIDKNEIAVYDVYGEKVAGRERIRIDKQNLYSGLLVWDCSNFDSGIYFIQIKHGTRTLTLKTMVNR